MANLVHRLLLGVLSPTYRLVGNVRAEGLAHIPDGGAVIVFNHPRNRDPLDVQAAYGRPLYFLGKKEAFDIPVVGWIMRNVGHQIPLDRAGGGNEGAMREAVAVLRRGDKVALAPEGTKSHGGPLGRGRSGAARMALEAGVPVVPAAVIPGRLRSRVVFGEALDLAAWRARADDPAAAREATDHMMAAIAALLGTPYDAARAPDYAAAKGFRPGGAQEETSP